MAELDLMAEEKIVLLESLVEELMKEQPNEHLIQDIMAQTGLHYSKDPITRINSVLQALEFNVPTREAEL